MDRLITLRTYTESVNANLARMSLESHGVQVYLKDEEMVNINLLFSNAIGGIKLQVEREQQEKALEVLTALNDQALIDDNGDVMICANCGSNNLEFRNKSPNNAMGIFSMLISLLFLVFPFFLKSVITCKECQYEFPRE